MRARLSLTLTALSVLALVFAAAPVRAQHANQEPAALEGYLPEPMPPGFQVMVNAIEGPVFSDANGKTLYKWPLKGLRNGDIGDRRNAASNCTADVTKVNSGFMSPYPGGLLLPDLATRKSCQDVWPPVLADQGATPAGKWSVIPRKDGAKQWAYDGFPLYTSTLDEQPGDVLGGSNRNIRPRNDAPARREPVGPRSNIPPAFSIRIVGSGRLLVNSSGFSIYSRDGDRAEKSNCAGACLNKWSPVLAAEFSQPLGDWTIVQRSPGVRQWAFRKKPLYTYIPDAKVRSLLGSDEPGWRNVYMQPAPAWPKEFSLQETHAGLVLSDTHGKTIYVYTCYDDALDQQSCDHPTTPQDYRLAVCGGGDPKRCLETWPPVQAAKNAKPPSRSWTAIDINPLTGNYAKPGAPDTMHVWAFRGRPVYTFAGDEVGDVEGDAWGEFYGFRNGFKAFWIRDDFFVNAG